MSRLIDADALEERFAEFNKGCAGECECCEHYIRDKWKKGWCGLIANAPTVGGWISVKDHLPESDKRVLASCDVRRLDGYRWRYTCVAFYAAKHSIPEGKYPEDDECYDYDEDEDEYYLKEGWYEVIHNWDEYSSVVIEDFVTHWMPLPEPPEEEDG